MPSSEQEGRRKFLQGVLPFVLGAYLETQRILNPTGLVTTALGQNGKRVDDQDEEAKAMLNRVKNLKATFEDGKLSVYLDRNTMLELIETHLKRVFAREESGMTATFRSGSVSARDRDFDGELRLPSRSIYLKFAPQEIPLVEYANSYMERARGMNPSELWLLTLSEEQMDVTFDPVFREKTITRGGLRALCLPSIFRELVGNDYDVFATQENGNYKFLVSKKQKTRPSVR
jgi:hypothetical protein